MEPVPPAMEAQTLNQWTTREVPFSPFYQRGNSWFIQIKKLAHRSPSWELVQPEFDSQPTAELFLPCRGATGSELEPELDYPVDYLIIVNS